MLLEYHDSIELDGMCYGIINRHHNYIAAQRILRSKEILEEVKAEAVLPLLFSEEIPKGKEVQAIRAYLDLFTKESKKIAGHPVFDIVQDSEYIYAGFMQAYGIDIDDPETNLKIEQFIALIKGLPSATKLAEVIKIREMPIPEPTKTNGRQRAAIIEAKAAFALEGEGVAKGWKSFGKTIKEWARHGK